MVKYGKLHPGEQDEEGERQLIKLNKRDLAVTIWDDYQERTMFMG